MGGMSWRIVMDTTTVQSTSTDVVRNGLTRRWPHHVVGVWFNNLFKDHFRAHGWTEQYRFEREEASSA